MSNIRMQIAKPGIDCAKYVVVSNVCLVVSWDIFCKHLLYVNTTVPRMSYQGSDFIVPLDVGRGKDTLEFSLSVLRVRGGGDIEYVEDLYNLFCIAFKMQNERDVNTGILLTLED